ncbi:MAG TPA: hypothetical protein PKC87_03100 [Candidatus Absconditabacterales bacterium]|nr:hypothetical protein [Candidatus Absconditabacterales bacterium]
MIKYKNNHTFQVLTPTGFKPFSGIRQTTKSKVVNLTLSDGVTVVVSLKHKVVVNGKEILAKDLKEGDQIGNFNTVEKIEILEKPTLLYDLVNVGTDNLYLTDSFTSHNCDFLSSGDSVIEPEILSYYEETFQIDPLEKRGVDHNLWIWEYPDSHKSYMIVADVSRGDSTDYSAFHIFDIETAAQIGEYKGKLSPKDFGNVLVAIASEYNDALLVVENANIGWATIEQILAREYKNLYYSSRSETETVESYMAKYERDMLVPGFTMSQRSRPLVIAKLTEYVREKSVLIRSKRLLSELRVFVWKNGKAQAQTNYNDDLVMSFATGLYVRDTAIRLRQQGMDLARAQLSSISSLNQRNPVVYNSTTSNYNNPYKIETPYGHEDLTWLLE